MENDKEASNTIGDLYPDPTSDQQQEAEQNLDAYIRIIGQNADRVFSELVNVEEEDADEEN